jgi:NAD(P)-dependent dehydrogenase (short-subunit alcohol dehydrogenase family)
MADVTAHFGRAPDLLVNSAALFGQDRPETVTSQDLMRHYAVNCAAPVLLTRAFAAAPVKPGRAVVNILDQRLANPHGDQLAYTLSKQALAGFTQIAARELAGRGIRVNAVAPGLTLATDDYDGGKMERLAGMMPLGLLPAPGQIGQAVLYLASATAVTGQVIAVDGGRASG